MLFKLSTPLVALAFGLLGFNIQGKVVVPALTNFISKSLTEIAVAPGVAPISE